MYNMYTHYIYIYIYIYIYDSQREKAFLKIFRPDDFFNYLYKTLYNFFYIVQSIKRNKLN